MQHTERTATGSSPFSFWIGFWSGLDAVMTMFYGPSKFNPRMFRYPESSGLSADLKVVGHDFRKAVSQAGYSKRAVNG